MHVVARRYDTAQAVRIEWSGDRINRIDHLDERNTASAAEALPFVAPGFVDIQVNGYGGQEFSSLTLTPEGVRQIVRRHYAFGVTSLCPTLTTESFEVLTHGLAAIARACDEFVDVARSVVGIHLEGPFLSAEDGPRGAHPPQHCRPPDWDFFQRLQEAAGGRIVLVTLSPEYPQAPAFIVRAVAAGVVVAIGHTGATSEQIRRAVDAGARLSTHLGNGAHRLLRRHPNYLWDQLADDRLWASLIVDGHHLPPEVVRVFVRAKTPGRVILVSDLSGLAGLPAGRHASSGCELEILADGRLVIAGQDQLLAGASRPIGVGVANVMRFAGVDLASAVAMATTRPAELLGREAVGLRAGDPANLVLFQLGDVLEGAGGLAVLASIVAGQLVHGHLPT
jgi:N-acetylglucosamine-6-phosphate deacetylase